MKPEPVIPIYNDDEQEFYDSYVSSRRSAADRLKRRYSTLEKRLQRLEHTVTTPEFDWEQRLNEK
jgi:phage shock protein C